MIEWKKNYRWIIGLFLIGIFIYAFNFNGQLFWDDDDWIINNPFVHSLSWQNVKSIFTTDILHGFGLNSNYYRPLLLLSFAFNWVLHGSNPIGYHIVSNGFHIGNAILIFFLLTTSNIVRKRAAFVAALLWLVHPLNVEAVAYISGRGDPMSVFFILLGLLLFIVNKRWWAALAMILAVLSRETAILFPALAMVFYLSFLIKSNITMSNIVMAFKKTAPYWSISAFYMLLRLTILNFQNTLNFYNQSNIYTEHLSYRLYTFGSVLVEYFRLIFWPTGLHMERELAINTSLFQWPSWLGVVMILLIIAVGFIFYRKENPKHKVLNSRQTESRISDSRMWIFSWGWFFITLSPASGIIPINALIYEHWLYLPLIGVAVLAGFYIDKIINLLKNKKSVFYFPLIIFFVIYFSFFAIQSIKRNIAWGNSVTFYEEILRYSPDSIRIINNLGNLYSKEGRTDDAARMYQRIIDNPKNSFAQPYYNLGNTYRDKGDLAKAEELYKQAIEKDNNFPFAYQNLIVIYANTGRIQEAIRVLEELKKIKPDINLDDVMEYLKSQTPQ